MCARGAADAAVTAATPPAWDRYRKQLEAMFEGLDAEDLPTGTQIISTLGPGPAHLLEPLRWASCSTRAERCRALHDVMPLCGDLGLILFFCDLTDDEQFQGLLELVFYMDGNQDAPPLLCVQVSPAGQVCAARFSRLLDRVGAAMDLGLQDVIAGGQCGQRLALQVRASVIREDAVMRRLNEEIDARRLEIHRNKMLRFHTSSILWQDLPQRMRLSIPLADLAAEEKESEAGVARRLFGEPLLRGCWGWVRQARYRPASGEEGDSEASGASAFAVAAGEQVEQPEQAEHAGQAESAECVKIIVKGEVTTLASLRAIHHMISCMQEVSTEEGRHPNVLHLLEVTSTREHLYLHMGPGDRCLHHRLLESKKSFSSPQRLSGEQLWSLSSQVVAACRHLHERRICHRDLKPESFLIQEDAGDVPGGVRLKLTNLDLAIRQPAGVLFGTSCGTAPFAAPEVSVAMRGRYDGLRADMWSVGVTLLELFAGVGVLEDLVRGPATRVSTRHYSSMELLLDVQQFFARPGAVHEAANRLVFEARPYRARLEQALGSLLCLEPHERCTAEGLAEQLIAPAEEARRPQLGSLPLRPFQISATDRDGHAAQRARTPVAGSPAEESPVGRSPGRQTSTSIPSGFSMPDEAAEAAPDSGLHDRSPAIGA